MDTKWNMNQKDAPVAKKATSIFKSQLDVLLGNQLWVVLLEPGQLDKISEVLSIPTSVIL